MEIFISIFLLEPSQLLSFFFSCSMAMENGYVCMQESNPTSKACLRIEEVDQSFLHRYNEKFLQLHY